MTVLGISEHVAKSTSNGRNPWWSPPLDLGDRGVLLLVDGTGIIRATGLGEDETPVFTDVTQAGSAPSVNDTDSYGWQWLNGSVWFARHRGTSFTLWQGAVNADASTVTWTQRGSITVTNSVDYSGGVRLYGEQGSSDVWAISGGPGVASRPLTTLNSGVGSICQWNGTALRQRGSVGTTGNGVLMATSDGDGSTIELASGTGYGMFANRKGSSSGLWRTLLTTSNDTFTFSPDLKESPSISGQFNVQLWLDGVDTGEDLFMGVNVLLAGLYLYKANSRGASMSSALADTIKAAPAGLTRRDAAIDTQDFYSLGSRLGSLQSNNEVVAFVWDFLSSPASTSMPVWADTYDPETRQWESGASAWQTVSRTAWPSGENVRGVHAQDLYRGDVGYVHVVTDRRHLLLIVRGNRRPLRPSLNATQPSQPEDLGPGRRPGSPLVLTWQYTDPDGDSQGHYNLRRVVGNTTRYWNGSAWVSSPQKVASPDHTLTLAAGWGSSGDADHEYAVQVWDDKGLGPSDWSNNAVVPVSIPIAPRWTTPSSSGQFVRVDSIEASWTVSQQTYYRIIVRETSATGGLVSDTTRVLTDTKDTVLLLPEDGKVYWLGLQTWNDEGVVSAVVPITVVTSWFRPADCTLNVSPHPATDTIDVRVSSSAGGRNTPPHTYEIQRRGGEFGQIDVARLVVSGSTTRVGTHRDYHVASGVDYGYRARGLAGEAVYGSWSAWIS